MNTKAFFKSNKYVIKSIGAAKVKFGSIFSACGLLNNKMSEFPDINMHCSKIYYIYCNN